VPILEERGYFWWFEDNPSPSALLPESAVPGVLKIDVDGRITLQLDGQLRSLNPPGGLFPIGADPAELLEGGLAGF
jgi:hypothetical protein